MYVVVYVVNAVAVVALAAGAVAELQVGVGDVGPAADLTFVAVALHALLVLRAVDGVSKFAAGLGIAPVTAEIDPQIAPAEEEEVEYADNGKEVEGERRHVPDYPGGENGGVEPCRPLHFDGDEEKDAHYGVGPDGGEGKEHGEVQVLGRHHAPHK